MTDVHLHHKLPEPDAEWLSALSHVQSDDPRLRLQGLEYLVTHHASDCRTMDSVRNCVGDSQEQVRRYADQQFAYVCRECSAPYAHLAREELLVLVRHWYKELTDLDLFAFRLGSVCFSHYSRRAEASRRLRCIEVILGGEEMQKAGEECADQIRRSVGIRQWNMLMGLATDEEIEEFRDQEQRCVNRTRRPGGFAHTLGRQAWDAIPSRRRWNMSYCEKEGSGTIASDEGNVTFCGDGFFCCGLPEAVCPSLLEYCVPGSVDKIEAALSNLAGVPITLDASILVQEETDNEPPS